MRGQYHGRIVMPGEDTMATAPIDIVRFPGSAFFVVVDLKKRLNTEGQKVPV